MATEIVDCCSYITRSQYWTCAVFLLGDSLLFFFYFIPALRRRGADAARSGQNALRSSVVPRQRCERDFQIKISPP